MASSTEIKVQESREWVRDGRTLVVISGDKVEIKAAVCSVEEQAAICYILLTALANRCGVAPFSVAAEEVEHVADALSSIAEFPSIVNS